MLNSWSQPLPHKSRRLAEDAKTSLAAISRMQARVWGGHPCCKTGRRAVTALVAARQSGCEDSVNLDEKVSPDA
jgi:hypothetical protein